jgi:dihydrofolate reductase
VGVVEITLALSLDGFITGPDATAEQPLGVGGAPVLRPGGEMWMTEEAFSNAGAVVAGRTVYDHTGGWGEEPPFRMPVFVPTHRPREVRVAGATTFTFVPDVESAIARAKAVAGEKNVHIMGGAGTADQALRLGLVDELNLHIDPVLLGGGTRLFADIGTTPIRLERTRLIEGPATTHIRFRVLR